MGEATALKLAIDLLHVPSQVRRIRSEPLPDGLLVLLRIAAADGEAEDEAAKLTGRSPEVVRQAATFFIEQVLLSPNSDSYRVLGASPETTSGELRRNMALLLRWLHPDIDRRGDRAVFAARVTRAWNDLKTLERRRAYDLEYRGRPTTTSLHRNSAKARTRSCKQIASQQRFRDGVAGNRGKKLDALLRSHAIVRNGGLYRALLRLFRGHRY